MALNKMIIGTRIRKIREDIYKESRKEFGNRCNLTERHIGQIERGDNLLNLSTLDKIISATGIDIGYILYGNEEKNKHQLAKSLHNFIDKCDVADLQFYNKFITSHQNYINTKISR